MQRRRIGGMTLIEVMVGLVIGLVTILIVYQVYGLSERYKRNTTSAGDAQTTGLFSTFFLSQTLANGGAAISVNGAALEPCHEPSAGQFPAGALGGDQREETGSVPDPNIRTG